MVSLIIIDLNGTAGPRRPATNDESEVDARQQLVESHERRVQAVENAIVRAPAKRRAGTKTVLGSLTPFVPVVKPTHPQQCNDLRRG